ncbi:CHASE2 domain-containing protein [Parvularcula sp. LCG005]|uniref:CHASE2 domain-containing protein n=1 Tax=Parvularcula sp. LCG005 TaxID=3078805 RepID=UPI002941F018|nr:CHASE2 domain-containing protein [Parvularcula sp. LCG005]WOI54273.1 CHASE2 domain-containing protein [Parvularcula sp. LCG005]
MRPYRLTVVYALVAVFLTVQFNHVGLIRSFNNAITAARFALTPQQVGGSDSVVIAIDSESLQVDREWPWDRTRYAELVTALNEAGARQIAFDIDFSSPGRGDAAFAAALEASAIPVYLASFRQPIESAPGVVAEMQPTEILRQHALLASTTFPVDEDGLVRRMNGGEMFSDGLVPNLAYALAGEPAHVEQSILNASIDVSQVETISFFDALTMRDLRDKVNGKTVFIGATAIELGDEFVLPVLGLRSGIYLNVMAYETAASHTELDYMPLGATLFLVVLAVLASMVPMARIGVMNYTLLNVGTFVGVALLGYGTQRFAGLVADVAPVHIVTIIGVLMMLAKSADQYAAALFRSTMNTRKHAMLLDAMMASNHDGILTINRFGEVESCNVRGAELLGFEMSDVLNRSLADILPRMHALINQRECNPFELEIDRREGGVVDVSYTYVDLPIASSRYETRKEARQILLITLHDLTQHKALEIAERQAKESHERASAAKSALISTMSHELKTPLNSVIGFGDLIASEALGKHEVAEYAEFGQMISTSGKQLLNVVTDMLMAGRLQSGETKPSLQIYSLVDVGKAALSAAKLRQSWCDPEVEIDMSAIRVRTDKQLLTVALEHLLDNAAKFGGKDGKITVKAEAHEGQLSISVTDEGPGIAEEELCSVTQMFYQADRSRARTAEGCGLGLFLAEQAAQVCGGFLRLRNLEKGLCAEIVLPAPIEAAVPQKAVA